MGGETLGSVIFKPGYCIISHRQHIHITITIQIHRMDAPSFMIIGDDDMGGKRRLPN
jgi:hypothetical protein